MDYVLPSFPTACPIPVEAEPARRWSRRTELGQAVRLLRGSYVEAEAWASLAPAQRHRVLLEAWHRLHPEAVFVGASALALHGIPVLNPEPRVEVAAETKPRASTHHGVSGGRQVLRFTVHRRQSPFVARASGGTSGDVVGVGSWRLERLPQALARYVSDLRVDAWSGVVSLDAAWRGLGGDQQAGSMLVEAASKLRRAAAVDRYMAAWFSASPLAESPAETLARLQIRALGLADPEEQPSILACGRWYRPDFLWRPGMILEVDGQAKYGGPDEAKARRAEKEREMNLRRAGFKVARAEWQDIMQPESLALILWTLGVPARGENAA